MQTFDPPIKKRSTLELISMAHGTEEYWQAEAIKQAKEELVARKVSKEYQQDILAKWERENKNFEEQYQIWLENNQYERYTLWEMIKILFVSPIILTGQTEVGDSLLDLKRFNYKIMVKQRIALLLGGIVLWVGLFFGFLEIGEAIKMKEIEQVDISDWEKNRIVIDQE